jgi:hypothetical protein
VIHGTFDSSGLWWRPGGDFCERLSHALWQRGSAARCWDGLDRLAETFVWTGENSERGRHLAANALSVNIKSLCERRGLQGLHIVAHSHGGNVVAEMLESLSDYHIAKILSFTTIGTPFFHRANSRWHILPKYAYNALILVEGLFAILLISALYFLTSSYYPQLSADIAVWFLLLSVPAIVTGFWLIHSLLSFLFNFRPFNGDIRVFSRSIISDYDEAFLVIRRLFEISNSARSLAGASVRFALYPILSTKIPNLHLSFQSFLRSSSSLRNLVNALRNGIVSRGGMFVERGSAIPDFRWEDYQSDYDSRHGETSSDFDPPNSMVGSVVRYILTLFVAGFLLIDLIASAPILICATLLTRFAVHHGLNAIANMGVGNDLMGVRLAGVSTTPRKGFSDFSMLELPSEFEREMRRSSASISDGMWRAVFGETGNALSPFAGRDALSEIFRGAKYIHCRYYSEQTVIDAIADVIGSRDPVASRPTG